MRRKLLLLFNLLLLCNTFLTAQTFSVLDSVNNRLRGISPDGRYMVGIDTDRYNNGYKSFLWDLENDSFKWVTDTDDKEPGITNNGSFMAISNTGIIAGYSFDPDKNRAVATVWKEGERILLSFGSLEEVEAVESYAECINSDGTIVGGYLIEDLGGGLYDKTACIWSYQENTDTWDITELISPEVGNKVSGISQDGRVMIGYPFFEVYYENKPIIWIDGVIKEMEIIGNCHSLSENGKYIAILTSMTDAIIYSVEEDKYIPVTINFDDYYKITEIHISNNGEIYGTVEYVDAEYMQRGNWFRSFYFTLNSWLEGKAFADFEFIIRQAAPDLTLPGGISFLYEEKRNDVYINSLSADGSIIAGAAKINNVDVSWVFNTYKKEFIILNEPEPLEARISALQQVTLEWNTHYVTTGPYLQEGYVIYRDGEVISDGGEGIEEIEPGRYRFVDENVPMGYRSYAIAAIGKKLSGLIPIGRPPVIQQVRAEDENEFVESPKSEPVEVAVASNFDLPFFDDFETVSLKTNYWTTSVNPDKWWNFDKYSGIDGSYSLTSSHTDIKQTSFIISRHMDATQLDKVYMAYAKLFIELIVGTPGGILPNTGLSWLDVEISTDGINWRRVKRYNSDTEAETRTYGYDHEVLDISDWVAGEIFQVKFTIDGEKDAYHQWYIDWFSITGPVEKSPAISLKGYTKDDKVKLFWSDSKGNYELTHMVSQNANFMDSRIVPIAHDGKRGEELIIANGFDNYDLYVFHEMYLTSITAYLLGDLNSALELVVYENDKEIRRQPIRSITPDSENTLVLNEPVQINRNNHLKYGIRVTENDAEYIFIYQLTDRAIAGKSDLYSSDNGKTWNTLYDTFPEATRNGAWYLTANITETPVANTRERDMNLVSYYVYDNKELINDQFYSYHLTQTSAQKDDEGCYKVMAYYIDGAFSEFSNIVCIDDMDDITGQYVSIEENVIERSKSGFYPNPASNLLYITSSAKKVSILNLDGQTILISEKNEVDVAQLPEGVYFIKIETMEGSITTEKVIIKK